METMEWATASWTRNIYIYIKHHWQQLAPRQRQAQRQNKNCYHASKIACYIQIESERASRQTHRTEYLVEARSKKTTKPDNYRLQITKLNYLKLNQLAKLAPFCWDRLHSWGKHPNKQSKLLIWRRIDEIFECSFVGRVKCDAQRC